MDGGFNLHSLANEFLDGVGTLGFRGEGDGAVLAGLVGDDEDLLFGVERGEFAFDGSGLAATSVSRGCKSEHAEDAEGVLHSYDILGFGSGFEARPTERKP